MTRYSASLLAVGLLLLPATAAHAADKDKLQGYWKVEKAVRDGMEMPNEERDKLKLEFKGDKVIPHEGDRTEEAAEFVLDETKKPKAIDIKPPKGEEKLVKGIYELTGDTLKICFARAGERPTEFSSAAGSKMMFIQLKRAK